jgi:hypothetical protein
MVMTKFPSQKVYIIKGRSFLPVEISKIVIIDVAQSCVE